MQQQNDWKNLGICGLSRDVALFDALLRIFFASENFKIQKMQIDNAVRLFQI